MEISACNQKRRPAFSVWAASVFILSMFLITVSVCADNGTGDRVHRTDSHDEKIHITAQRLITDSDNRFAEFVGNVEAVQGETVIAADRLKIFYKSGLNGQENIVPREGSINKIVADGHVNIRFDGRTAVTQHAEYITETRTLVLSGDDSKVFSGTDYISGKKITYYRNDGRIVVEGSRDKQVEAVIHPGEKGIN